MNDTDTPIGADTPPAPPDCDCATSTVPGAVWPIASDGDSSLPYVEACGDCCVFATDDAAAEAIAETIGGRVMWAPLIGHRDSDPGGGLHPFVLDPRTVVMGPVDQADGSRTPALTVGGHYVNTEPSFPVSAAQVAALARSTYQGPDAAAVQLTSQRDGTLTATQGDETVVLDDAGKELN
jgi:hypothetical protein